MYRSLITIIVLWLYLGSAQGQCYPNRHNTSLASQWLSCSRSTNPNSDRGNSHWILYELDNYSALVSMKIWNLNHPDYLLQGAKSIAIDYHDMNGNWNPLGTYEVSRATGSGFYEGEVIELNGLIATDKVLITVLSTHGGGGCAGFGEIRLGLDNSTVPTDDIVQGDFDIIASPSPFTDFTLITITELNERVIDYKLINSIGQIIISNTVDTYNGKVQFRIDGSDLSTGNYLLKVSDGNSVVFKQISYIKN